MIQDIDLGYSISAHYMRITNYPHIHYANNNFKIYFSINFSISIFFSYHDEGVEEEEQPSVDVSG